MLFRIGDQVNYVDPHDDKIGIVIGIKYTKFSPYLPYIQVQYPGHVFTCHAEAFTFVGRDSNA